MKGFWPEGIPFFLVKWTHLTLVTMFIRGFSLPKSLSLLLIHNISRTNAATFHHYSPLLLSVDRMLEAVQKQYFYRDYLNWNSIYQVPITILSFKHGVCLHRYALGHFFFILLVLPFAYKSVPRYKIQEYKIWILKVTDTKKYSK